MDIYLQYVFFLIERGELLMKRNLCIINVFLIFIAIFVYDISYSKTKVIAFENQLC